MLNVPLKGKIGHHGSTFSSSSVDVWTTFAFSSQGKSELCPNFYIQNHAIPGNQEFDMNIPCMISNGPFNAFLQNWYYTHLKG